MTQDFSQVYRELQLKETNPLINRTVFTVMAKENGYLPAFTGHILRAIIQKTFEHSDPSLVTFLHEQNNQRPYAIKDIQMTNNTYVRRIDRTGEYKIFKGDFFTFEFITLGMALIDRSVKSLILDTLPELYLQTLPIVVKHIESNLIDIFTINQTSIDGKYSIQFLTPTQFNTKTNNLMILPEPVKIFHSLANIWNQLLPQHHIDIKSLINVIRHDVYIRAYKLKTAEINLGKNGTQVGFKGYIQLIIKKSESPQKPLLPLLLKFGEEMNIGRYRTVGMGQIQVRKLN